MEAGARLQNVDIEMTRNIRNLGSQSSGFRTIRGNEDEARMHNLTIAFRSFKDWVLRYPLQILLHCRIYKYEQ
jgi:hypothetical protein